ncbi:MAG: DEAD/DEAH box helicase [Opitutaceae bacterium]
MIFKSAVRKYLNQPLINLSLAKDWSDERLARELGRLKSPKFFTEPRRHQKIGFVLAVKYPSLFCMFDMGLGKTKVALDAVRYLRKIGKLRRVLILVPNVVNIEGWRMEIGRHAPDLSAGYITGSRRDRTDVWEGDEVLCVCTYAGLQSLVCSWQGNRRRIDPVLMERAEEIFDGAIFDESQALMNHRSLTFNVVSRLTRDFQWRLALTGTPMGRDPHVLWPQFFCVDRGKSLGSTLGPFRAAFFRARQNRWGVIDYTFKRKAEPVLRRMLSHSSIWYSSEECFDLPDLVRVDRPFSLSEEARAYYSAVMDQVRQTQNKLIDITGVFVRLRQITSGFVSVDGEPSPLQQNSKLDLLAGLLEEIPETEKVVVFNEFIYSGDLVESHLRSAGIAFARLYSGTRDKAGEFRRFVSDPKCRIFLANSQSAAQGLNLQVARYVVFYESPTSPIVRSQAEKRCHRPGQNRRVFVYDLFARRTVDQKILRYLAEGRDLFVSLIEGGLNILGGGH